MDTDAQTFPQDHWVFNQDQTFERELADFPPYQPCARCITDCAIECDDTCPVPEITSQCTDKCVIVPCDDPTHPEPEDTCGSTHIDIATCDSSCGNTDCVDVDCPRLDDALCCDGYQYFSAKSYETPHVNWDTSIAALLCACNESPAAHSQHPNLQEFIHPMPVSASKPDSALSSPSLVSTGSPFLSPNAPQTLRNSLVACHPCMWADCGAVFTSLNSLVGHVNLHHLRLPSSPLSNPYDGRNEMDIDSLSCLWGNCTTYPSSNTIPGPSTGNQVDTVLGVLATHLLQDHLGVCKRQTPPPQPPPSATGPVTPPHSSVSHSPSPAPHECGGTHVCRWKDCSNVFPSCDELTAHITAAHVGSGKSHYDCYWEGCTRNGEHGFSSKQKISRHLQSHTGHRPFQCAQCKQNFSEAATLQQHMRRHTREKPYVCDFPGCGKAFAITGALTIHKRTHNGDKPFKCIYCERAFTESSNLSKHLRTHTGVRPYTCSEDGCGKAFARPDQLARHMSVHRKKSGVVSSVT